VVWQGRKVLLVRRARPPRQGQWSIPGGLLELGETHEEGVRREVREETGLALGPLSFVAIVDIVERDPEGRVRFHYVLLDFTAEALPGPLAACDEVLEAAWFEPEAIGELGLWSETVRIIGLAAARR
jgi:ADP-ribose pyrophosphatase YjhB (NUDIX family)